MTRDYECPDCGDPIPVPIVPNDPVVTCPGCRRAWRMAWDADWDERGWRDRSHLHALEG